MSLVAARLGETSGCRNIESGLSAPDAALGERGGSQTQDRKTFMRIDRIPTGNNPPDDLNVIIEVPTGGEPVKYEFDKESGALFVDRILNTPMHYPANYGFVPHTLSPDGDPLDALVISLSPFVPGCVVNARPIGVLNLEDEHGGDEKIICVPCDATFPYYSNVSETDDLPPIIFQQIEHFFTHYKDLEKEKWVRIGNWGKCADARRIVMEAIERAKNGG
jgi:inorganic pyrophosphatase